MGHNLPSRSLQTLPFDSACCCPDRCTSSLAPGTWARQPSALILPDVPWDSGRCQNTCGLENAKGHRIIFRGKDEALS